MLQAVLGFVLQQLWICGLYVLLDVTSTIASLPISSTLVGFSLIFWFFRGFFSEGV
jgi:hypothetical protein